MAVVCLSSRSSSPESVSNDGGSKRSQPEEECFVAQKRLKAVEESLEIDVDALPQLVARLPHDFHQRVWYYYVSMFCEKCILCRCSCFKVPIFVLQNRDRIRRRLNIGW